ncbi:MAG: hypothetical protein DRJ01_18360 [Bacteroidetes bacterium]|nr:MAG: hypothetical protein DRJ01_18360 [Bacteroidota bacterium]
MDVKIIYIVWASPKTRAMELSKRFHAKLFGLLMSRSIPAIFRYFIFFIKTCLILIREKPDYVIIQVPPIFISFPVYLYNLINGSKYIIDVHSGELVDYKWKPFKVIRKFFFKHAYWLLFHNEHNYKLSEKLYPNCRNIILNDPIPIPHNVKALKKCGKYKNIVFISAFDTNEPFDECIKAGEILLKEEDDWKLTFTGDSSSIKKYYENHKNIEFTGFVSYKKYWAILKGADVIVSLNKRDGVVTCGLWEGVSLNKPVVTNDYDVIKKIFKNSVVVSGNDSISIAKAIKKAYFNTHKYSDRIRKRKEIIDRKWMKNFLIIRDSLV